MITFGGPVSAGLQIVKPGLTILLIFMIHSSIAQWPDNYFYLTPEEYVSNYLTEPGALISNVQFTGDDLQILAVTGLNNFGFGLPFDKGIVLSDSWAILTAVDVPDFDFPEISAYTPPAFSGPFDTGDGGVYEDLLLVSNEAGVLLNALDEEGDLIVNTQVFDVSFIEFDVVPTTDHFTFNYALSGGEYVRSNACYPNPYGASYASCEYMDVFGIFISGPGITGPYSSPSGFPDGSINTAFLPGTFPELPITSKSVNDSTNVSWYMQYCDSMSVDEESCLFTDYMGPVTNTVPVLCGQTYHIRMAIGDVFDHIYGWSAVIGAIGGTGNAGLTPVINFSYEPGGPAVYDVYEGCGPLYLNVHRSLLSDQSISDTLLIETSGTAQMIFDYGVVPDTVFLSPGQDVFSLPIGVAQDGMNEGIEDLLLSCQEIHNSILSCSVYAPIEIHDEADPLQITGGTVPICNQSLIELEPTYAGGYGNYTFEWWDGTVEAVDLIVNPTPGSYQAILHDVCGIEPDTAWFELVNVDPITLDMGADSIAYGCNMEISIFANATGGYGSLEYNWNPWSEDDPNYTYPTYFGPSTVYLTVTDDCDIEVMDSVVIYLDSGLPLNNLMDTLYYTGCDDQIELFPESEGGFEPYTYYWISDLGFGIGPSEEFTVTDTSIITVMTFDLCSQFHAVDVTVINGPPPLSAEIPELFQGTCLDLFTITPDVSGGEGLLNYQWTLNNIEISDQDVLEIQDVLQDSEIILSVTDECLQLAVDSAQIVIQQAPLLLSLPPDTSINCSDDLLLMASVSGGNGVLNYDWWVDGIEISTEVPELFVEDPTSTLIELIVTDECGYEINSTSNLVILTIPLDVDLGEDIDQNCFEDVLLSGTTTGGNGELSFSWMMDEEILPENSSELIADINQDAQAIITVTDQCGIISTDTVQIVIQSIPILASDTTYHFCYPGNYELSFGVSGGNGILSYNWGNELTAEPMAVVQIDTSYSHLVIITDECLQNDSVYITNNLNTVSTDIQSTAIADFYYNLVADTINCPGCEFYWNISGSLYESGEVNFYPEETETEIELIGTNEFGCSDTSNITLPIFAGVFIPNAFTPDGDGVNDQWGITSYGYDEGTIQVFDRWGEIMFETDDINKRWIGNMKGGEYYASDGVYVYRVVLKQSGNVMKELKGTLTMFR